MRTKLVLLFIKSLWHHTKAGMYVKKLNDVRRKAGMYIKKLNDVRRKAGMYVNKLNNATSK